LNNALVGEADEPARGAL